MLKRRRGRKKKDKEGFSSFSHKRVNNARSFFKGLDAGGRQNETTKQERSHALEGKYPKERNLISK